MLVDSEGHVDRLSMLGLCMCIVSVLLYHYVVYEHFRTYVDYQLQILSLRVAMIIPIYSIVATIMLIQPAYAYFFEAVAVLCEGYAIYCYFALIVSYCGGKEAVYELIKSSHHTKPCYASCQQNTPQQCFQAINVLLLQFMFVRPIFTLMHGVVGENNQSLGQVFRLLSVLSLVVGMLGLLRIYHILAEHAKEMDATAKIVFIKVMILCIAVEDLIINAVFASGALEHAKTYGNYTEAEKEIRLYSFIVIAEFMLASLLAVKYFHPTRIGSNDSEPLAVSAHAEGGSTTVTQAKKDVPDTSNLSYTSYIKDLLQIRYIFTHPPGFGKLMNRALSDEEAPCKNEDNSEL